VAKLEPFFAETLAAAHRHEESISVASRILGRGFENPQIHNLIEYCLESGFPDGGEKYLETRVAGNPNDAMGLLHLAKLLLRKGKWLRAEETIRRCLGLEPKSTLAADVAARCHVVLGNYQQAAQIFGKIWDAAARATLQAPAVRRAPPERLSVQRISLSRSSGASS
jgi:uncharacterized protein HemY